MAPRHLRTRIQQEQQQGISEQPPAASSLPQQQQQQRQHLFDPQQQQEDANGIGDDERETGGRSRKGFSRRDACIIFAQHLIAAKGLRWEDALLLHQALCPPDASSSSSDGQAAAAGGQCGSLSSPRSSSSSRFSSASSRPGGAVTSSSSSSSSSFAGSLAFEEFLSDFNAFLLPTGLRARKVYVQGLTAAAAAEGRAEAAAGAGSRLAAGTERAAAAAELGGVEEDREAGSCWLLLTSEAAAEFPLFACSAVTLLLKKIAAARGFPPSLPLRLLKEAARRMLRAGTALSLLEWVNVCKEKNADPPESLLQLFLENRLLQIPDGLSSSSSSSSASSSSASSSSACVASTFSPSSPCLEFGPACFVDHLRLLKHLLPGEELECSCCHLAALGKAFCCGNAACSAVFHAACTLRNGLPLSSSTSGSSTSGSSTSGSSTSSDHVDVFPQQQTPVCPACERRWRGVRAERAASLDCVDETAPATAATTGAAEEVPADAPGAVPEEAQETGVAALAESTVLNQAPLAEEGAAAAQVAAAAMPAAAARDRVGRVKYLEAAICKTEVKEEEGEERKEEALQETKRKRRLSPDTPRRTGKRRGHRAGKRR